MPHHMIWHSVDGEGDRDILKYYRNHPDIRFKTADKQLNSCTSKLKLNRDDKSEGLPEAVANIEPEITKNSQTKVSNGQKKPLCKNHDSSMTASAAVEMEINLSKCITFSAMLLRLI